MLAFDIPSAMAKPRQPDNPYQMKKNFGSSPSLKRAAPKRVQRLML
jgi:hypothetical protein